jgi:carnitine-CoA ligase
MTPASRSTAAADAESAPSPDETRPEPTLPALTIPELLAAAAAERGGDRYLRTLSEVRTVGELARDVAHTRSGLLRLGVRPGNRVAVMLSNDIEHVVVVLALIAMRAIWVPVNPQLRGEPLARQLRVSDPTLFVMDARFADVALTAAGAVPTLAYEHGIEPPWRRAGVTPMSGTAERSQTSDVIAIMFTSGTTGPPKGVQVTDRMLVAAAYSAVHVSGVQDGDVCFLWEPICHIGGAQMLLVPLIRHVALALVERFSASRFWSQVIDLDATHIHHLGGILAILLSRPPTAAEREHRVRYSWGGGMTADIWRRAESRFGVRVRECYGVTEASSISTANLVGPERGIGHATPFFDVALNGRDGNPVADNVVGEIVLRPRVPGVLTPGYFRDADATGRALRDGGWHTGDLGRCVDGALHYVGRRSQSIRHRGENVSAWEVESVVNSHPLVRESAVVGVPAADGEQDLKLYVALRHSGVPRAAPDDTAPDAAVPDVAMRDPVAFDPADILAWCRGLLAPFQIPSTVVVVDEFPRTPSQRIDRARLSAKQ